MPTISRRAMLAAGAGVTLAACVHPAPEPAPAREGRIAVPGGTVWWQRFGGGAKTPLLAVHGGPGATSHYLETLAALGDERPVYMWDQLGCGRSERPTDPSLWRIDRFVEEMDIVRNELGLERVHILGQSWGTCLSADYLLNKGQTGVQSVVLAGPVMSARRYIADVRPMILELSAEHQAAIAAAEISGNYQTPEYLAATEAFYARHVVRNPTPETAVLWQRSMEQLGVECYVAMNGPSEFSFSGSLMDYEREAELHRLRLPVLYLSGEYDTCTPAAARQYAAATPNAEVAVIANAGHCTTIDAPAETNAALRAFISRYDS